MDPIARALHRWQLSGDGSKCCNVNPSPRLPGTLHSFAGLAWNSTWVRFLASTQLKYYYWEIYFRKILHISLLFERQLLKFVCDLLNKDTIFRKTNNFKYNPRESVKYKDNFWISTRWRICLVVNWMSRSFFISILLSGPLLMFLYRQAHWILFIVYTCVHTSIIDSISGFITNIFHPIQLKCIGINV